MVELNMIYNMDCLEGLREIPNGFVNSVITSPPYYNLRNYGSKLGLEDSVDEYIENLVAVFNEIRRVLSDDGSVYVNISDTYGKGKCLLCVPDKFKMEMIRSGWICRNEIIWHKPNAMPSSVKDRFNVDYEKIYMFTKKTKYKFNTQYEPMKTLVKKQHGVKYGNTKYDSEEIEKSARQGMYRNRGGKIVVIRKYLPSQETFVRYMRSVSNPQELSEMTGIKKTKVEHWFRYDSSGFSYPSKDNWILIRPCVNDGSDTFRVIDKGMTEETYETDDIMKNAHRGRVKRSVWSIPTSASLEKHFATYPLKLILTPLMASTDENDIVLDPFMGSGTTAIACIRNNRNFIGFELNPEYCRIAEKLIKTEMEIKRLKLF